MHGKGCMVLASADIGGMAVLLLHATIGDGGLKNSCRSFNSISNLDFSDRHLPRGISHMSRRREPRAYAQMMLMCEQVYPSSFFLAFAE